MSITLRTPRSSPPPLTVQAVEDALRVCYDPELPVNVVDLGLVVSVEVGVDEDAPGIEPRYRVRILLTMRSPNDEREGMLRAQVVNRLLGMPDISRAEVDTVWTPVWTTDRMSDAARHQLGLTRPAPQGLVTIRTAG